MRADVLGIVAFLLAAVTVVGLPVFLPRKGRLFLAGTAVFGLTLPAFALTDVMAVGLGLIFLAGLASAGFGVLQSTLCSCSPRRRHAVGRWEC